MKSFITTDSKVDFHCHFRFCPWSKSSADRIIGLNYFPILKMMDDDCAISMLSGIILFSLSASIFQLKRVEENRLYYWLGYFCSDLQIKIMLMDSKSSDTDPETASPCSPGSSHGKTLSDSDETRLQEMQRVFGYHQDFFSAREPISRKDSSRYVRILFLITEPYWCDDNIWSTL